jgi:hypothetical protein
MKDSISPEENDTVDIRTMKCKLNSLTPTLTLVEVPSDYPIEYAHQLRT